MQMRQHILRPRSAFLIAGLICGIAAPAWAQGQPLDFKTEFQQSLTALPPPKTLTTRGNVYVPAYSIRTASEKPPGLATLLRIDNTSSNKPLVLERVDYFDTTGTLVQRYIETPIALKPFGAIQIFIPAEDRRGGPASNFIVTWAGNGPIAEPLIETVMFGTVDGASYSFVSPGRAIKTVGKRQWFSLGVSR